MHQLLKLTIAYDGTNYKGWQDSRMGPSVEGTLRAVIEQIQQHPVQLQAASRTDAGVHADAQVATFETEALRKDPDNFLLSCNALLPPSIRILEVEKVRKEFHPSLQTTGKEYHYWLTYGTVLLPKLRWTTWHTPGELDFPKMEKAAEILTGTHDFAAFCNERPQKHYSDTIRTINDIRFETNAGQLLCIKISGTNFLYKMVRNLVGTLIYVGRGKLTLEELPHLLQGGVRAQAGVTAPAHGLTLHKVFY